MNSGAKKIVDTALGMVGKNYKSGQTAMCADFVSYVLLNSGFNYHTTWVPDMTDEEGPGGKGWGERVSKLSDLQAGDIVIFDNTYLNATFTHVGIYVGDNYMVHRPTSDRPVEKAYLEDYWTTRFSQGRRVWIAYLKEDSTDRMHDFAVYCQGGKLTLKTIKELHIKKGDLYEILLTPVDVQIKGLIDLSGSNDNDVEVENIDFANFIMYCHSGRLSIKSTINSKLSSGEFYTLTISYREDTGICLDINKKQA